MTRSNIVVAFGLALVAIIQTIPAHAQNARSFVSGHGNDGNNCGLATPCRTFAGALTKTNPGGEIDVLDPAGYGAMTIMQAVSIVNDGVGTAGVVVPASGIGIIINANPGDAVSLRGLSIEGGGTGATGIQFNTGQSLTVENCVIRHMGTGVNGDGIDFLPNASSSLAVSNSLVADNDNLGIFVGPTGSGAVTAVFNRVEVNNNSVVGVYVDGVTGTGTIKATASESVVAGNGNAGFEAFTGSGLSPIILTVFHSVSASNRGDGVVALGTGATIRLAQSVVTGNGGGWDADTGGVIASYGDNYIDGNGSNFGSLTTVTKQ